MPPNERSVNPDSPTRLSAGRELDILVASEVMGWEPYSGGYYYGRDGKLLACLGHANGTMGAGDEPMRWSPTTDPGAAWHVVESMCRANPPWYFSFEARTTDTWEASFNNGIYRDGMPTGFGFDIAASAPLAICRAALAALETQKERPAYLAEAK